MSRTSHVPAMVVAFLCAVFLSSGNPVQTQGRGASRDAARRTRERHRAGAVHEVPRARPDRQLRRISRGRMGRAVRHDGRAADRSEGAVAGYLAKNFPEQPRPPPVVIPGPVNVSIKEWNVPTLGSRPHDPEPGPGGTIWWTGMFANVLGRFDPKTGEFKEYPAKTPASGPHGLEFDKDGNLWFTANSKGYIGKLDPKTGDSHRIQAAGQTSAIRIRRSSRRTACSFSPRRIRTTSAASIRRPARSRSRRRRPSARIPYGMVMSSKGVPFVCDFGTNKIIRIDPDTLAIKEYELPNRRQPAAADRDQPRRHHLVRGLLARLSRPPRSEYRQGHRVAIAERPEVATLRHHLLERRDLVRRVGDQAERARAVRHQDARSSRAGSSRAAAASCATSRPPTTATS